MRKKIILPKGITVKTSQIYNECRTVTVFYRGTIYDYFNQDIIFNKLVKVMETFLVPRPLLAKEENPYNIYVENCIDWKIVSSDNETNTWEMIISPTFLPELPNIIIIEI